ncbi:MAG: HPr family phosphocarrier protein [Desulfobacteraceae bacterium]|nr:HPr family phosphocarrier protein [Desulfobacteraceae bacterium]
MAVIEKKVRIPNKLGLHGRASARLVGVAAQFAADIRLRREEEEAEADCKSILDVLSTACAQGTAVTIRAEGEDAAEAIAALERLLENKFDEE